MKKGEIVEQAIRRSYVNLSDLARKLSISRRTLYNWFNQEDLDIEVISKIGEIIHHDFSKELPGLYEKRVFREPGSEIRLMDEIESASYWRSKYINLLEKHNDLLVNTMV
jgi:hypothetical protein